MNQNQIQEGEKAQINSCHLETKKELSNQAQLRDGSLKKVQSINQQFEKSLNTTNQTLDQSNPLQGQNKQSSHGQNHQQQEPITQQTIQHFNKICADASTLMYAYKEQSQQLKDEISGMVNIYSKTSAQTGNAVPVEQIMSITKQYEVGMRQANNQYENLSQDLKKQEKERDQMMLQIQQCFEKLQRMEIKMKNKKLQKQKETTKENIQTDAGKKEEGKIEAPVIKQEKS